ncbi:MAG TPA: DUF1294 domain-containing protein [Sphingobium sp.]
MPYALLVVLLALLNLWTILCFRQDKVHARTGARTGKRRIPERDLLTLALIGGSPGAFLARRIFRHKTRKEPFSTYLKLIACVQAGVLIGWYAL